MTDRCVHVQAGDAEQGQTGVTYAAGISAATAGARGLSLQIASLPSGGGPAHISMPSMSQLPTSLKARWCFGSESAWRSGSMPARATSSISRLGSRTWLPIRVTVSLP